MRLTKRIISAVTAMTVYVGTAALFPVTANAAAVNWDRYFEACPKWIPTDFESAMNFYNTYGSTKAENDTICIVRHVPDNYKMKADISAVYNSEESRADSAYESHISAYDFRLPDEPDKSDAKAYSDYVDTMDRYKFYGIDADWKLGYHYEVLVILNNTADGFDINVKLEDLETGRLTDGVTYSFASDDNKLTETDIYSWLPDSVPEFNGYIKENGNISFREGMLIYCNNINYSTGAGLNVEQSGTGKLKLAFDGDIPRDVIIQSSGGTSSVMRVYKGETEGNAEITFTSGRSWAPDGEDHKEITASVHIDENLNVTDNNRAVPGWIPQDYESALSFCHEHGASFVTDGVICFVRQINPQRAEQYPVSFEGSASGKIKSYEVLNKIYTDPESNYNAYNVMAYEIPNNSDITVNYRYGRFKETERAVASYSFKKDSTGFITQTDIYSWLPDCDEEFSAYYAKHGAFSVQAGYVMYCTDVPASTSTDIYSKQEGSGAFIEEHQELLSKQYISSDKTGKKAQKHIIKLFKPIKAGAVKLVLSQVQGYGKEISYKDEAAYFLITDDLKITEAEEKDVKTTVKGDCNGDGAVGISDIVTLSKWLRGKGSLSECGNADANGDGCVDIFDLVAIRKQLIKSITDEPRPVMLMINENYAWSAYQHVTVIDQYGTAYEFKFSRDMADWSEVQSELFSIHSENWYDKLLDIMAASSGSAGYISDSAMAEINRFAEKTADYSNTKMYSVGYMCDAGSDTLYLINTGKDGKPVKAEIATFGDAVGWIDEPEVIEFVKMLSSYNIYGGNIIELLDYNSELLF